MPVAIQFSAYVAISHPNKRPDRVTKRGDYARFGRGRLCNSVGPATSSAGSARASESSKKS
jgi:hypothetical protein